MRLTKAYFECHITFFGSKENETLINDKLGWKFSIIDGDPVLGKGLKSYATKHYPYRLGKQEVVSLVKNTAYLMRELGLNVIREKVELVVFDSKQDSEIK